MFYQWRPVSKPLVFSHRRQVRHLAYHHFLHCHRYRLIKYLITFVLHRSCGNSDSSRGISFNTTLEAMENMTKSRKGCQYMISNTGSAKYYISSKYCKELSITGSSFFSWGYRSSSEKTYLRSIFLKMLV